MKKDIYKITNKINGKVYIGQSVNCKRRFKEHKAVHPSSSKSKIRNAILKYGEENFTYEIIERNIENYNEREKWWISYYKSNKEEFGYNITEGGENPPVIKGDKSFFAVYNELQVEKAIYDIINTNKSFEIIAKENNLNVEYISFLNRGLIRNKENLLYPLRVNGNEITSREKVEAIINDLIMSYMSFANICRKHKVSKSVVYDINNGKHIHCPHDIQYPIREKYAQMSQYGINKLIEMLKANKLKRNEIAKQLGISNIFVSRFNNGKIYKQNNVDYPIRKSSQRVY